MWDRRSKADISLRQPLQRINIEHAHARALRQINDPELPQLVGYAFTADAKRL